MYLKFYYIVFCLTQFNVVFINFEYASASASMYTNKSVVAGNAVVLMCFDNDFNSSTTGYWKLPAQIGLLCNFSLFLLNNGSNSTVFCGPSTKVFRNNGSLAIENTNINHTGVYSCSWFRYNKLLKTTVNLTVHDRPSKPFSLNVSERNETYLIINWTPPITDNHSSITHYKVTWLKKKVADGGWNSQTNIQDDRANTSFPNIIPTANVSYKILPSYLLSFNITNLLPYTFYCISVSAENLIGLSEPLGKCAQRTAQCRPLTGPSIGVKFVNSTCVEMDLKILNRTDICGEMRGYEVKLFSSTLEASGDKASKTQQTRTIVKNSTLLWEFFNVSGLLPYTSYEVRCNYFNDRYASPESFSSFKTDEGLPESPQFVHLPSEKFLSTSIVVNFVEPRSYNGKPKGFQVQYSKQINNSPEYKLIGVLHVDYMKNEPKSYEALIHQLEPATQYRVRVAAENGHGVGEWSENYTVRTDLSAPDPATEVKVETDLSSAGPVLMWSAPATEYAENLFFSVCWRIRMLEWTCQSAVGPWSSKGAPVEHRVLQGCSCRFFRQTSNKPEINLIGEDRSLTVDLCDKKKTCYVLHWSQLKAALDDALHRGQIRTSSVELNFLVRARLRSMYRPDTFLDGQDSKSVNLVMLLSRLQEFVNNPSVTLSNDVTKENIIMGVTVAVAIGVILIAVVGFISYRYMCGHRGYMGPIRNIDVIEQMNFSNIHHANGSAALSNRNGTSGSHAMFNPPVLKTYKECSFSHIPVEQFRSYVNLGHSNSKHKFLEDWEDVNSATKRYPSFVCDSVENRDKNRYTDISCFDHSRVILQSKLNLKNSSDYINANFVDGYNLEKAFIAAQGPMPDTFEDFWLMIWENACPVVVMISNLVECGRRKCDQYWPSEGVATYGQIQVRFIRYCQRSYYAYRVFSVCRSGGKKSLKERLLHHFHYTEWPDFGVPTHSLQVLQFVRRTVEHKADEVGPTVVHCSAGVGRTGTYICIQAQMEQIAHEHTVNVKGWLTHIRQQRVRLVQSEQQFYFIHDTLAEYILYPEHEIHRDNLLAYVSSLTDLEMKSDCGLTRLEHEFELCTSEKLDQSSQMVARKDVNLIKSRSSTIYPIDSCRVKLTTIGVGEALCSQERGDYINASILSGFYASQEFIVTQHPMENTITDLWRMVWDQNSAHLVLFEDMASSDAMFECADAEKQELLMDVDNWPQFWPSAGQSKECAFLSVAFREEEELQQLPIVRKTEFRISNSRDDYSLLTNLWRYSRFPVDIDEALEMVQFIELLNSRRSDSSAPLIVIDLLGGNEAAFFCALIYCLDQLRAEKCVDVYMIVKMYHLQRPGIWNHGIEKVELLYRTLAAVVCDSRVPRSPVSPKSVLAADHTNGLDQQLPDRLLSENVHTSQVSTATPSRCSTSLRHDSGSHEPAAASAFTF